MALAFLLACLAAPGFAAPLDLLIEERLAPYLARGRALEPDLELRLDYEAGAPDQAQIIEEFRFNAQNGGFVARLRLEDGSFATAQGRAVLGVEAWVPNRRIEVGEVITAADLSPVLMPPGVLNATLLRAAEDLIGQEVRRTLLPDRPVQDRAVIAPRAVIKGAQIEIRFTAGALRLAAPGKALSDGAVGELIRVVNTSSNTIVSGLITAPGVVEVK